MNNECEKIKDRIADYVSGVLPDDEATNLQRHLNECPACNEYTRALKDEDKLLTALFAEIDTNMQARQQRVLQAISHTGQSGQYEAVSPWIQIMKSRITKFAAAAAIIIAVFIALHQFGGSTVAWADVAEKFRSVPFFSAVLYMKDDVTGQPEQIELWRNRAGLVRMRIDNQVIFAEKGRITKTFDIKSQKEVEPDARATPLILMMGDVKSFSLETIINSFSGGELVNVTPLINTDAVISEDLLVFDIESENSTQWCRIWALRTSKLPIQIRMWDPRDGACADVLLTYSKEQQGNFFNPEAFASRMKSLKGKEINIAYMFLKDPGGKQIFPGSLVESEIFQVVTNTLDGHKWSLTDHHGKAILINFWDRRDRKKWEAWLKDTYERFKNIEDFLMVGVSLRKDAESTRRICEEHSIPWLQLHEPDKCFDNSLSKAFGVDDTYKAGWLVWKNGSIDRLGIDEYLDNGKVEGAVLGLTYDSERWIHQILLKGKAAGTLTIETVEQICGKPHSVNKTDNGERWEYILYNEEKTAVRNFHIDFDQTSNWWNWGSSHRLLDPAVVTVSFSSKYLKEHIEDQVEPEIRGKLFKEYLVTVSAESGNKGYPLCWKKSLQAEESYTRQLFPGIYDFVVQIYASSDGTKWIKTIKILENVELAKDEERTIRFE